MACVVFPPLIEAENKFKFTEQKNEAQDAQ